MSHRPWAIVAIFPSHKPKEIGRVRNRADADAQVRFLQRHVPQSAFYVVFDPEFDPEKDQEMESNRAKLEEFSHSDFSGVDFEAFNRN